MHTYIQHAPTNLDHAVMVEVKFTCVVCTLTSHLDDAKSYRLVEIYQCLCLKISTFYARNVMCFVCFRFIYLT